LICFLLDPGSWDSRQLWLTTEEVHVQDTLMCAGVQQQLVACRRLSNPQCNSFVCPDCGKIYSYKKNLLRHRRLECGKEPQFQCLYCSHKTTQKGNLLQHMKKIHSYNN